MKRYVDSANLVYPEKHIQCLWFERIQFTQQREAGRATIHMRQIERIHRPIIVGRQQRKIPECRCIHIKAGERDVFDLPALRQIVPGRVP